MKNFFDQYAKVYDVLYRDKDYENECAYVLSLLDSNEVRTALDVGCGTGKFAEQFSYRGLEVDGIDLSQNMLHIAHERLRTMPANERLEISYSVADIRGFRSSKRYDLVYSLFHVINYMTSDEDLREFFCSAAAVLRKGGFLVFDFWNGPGVEADRPVKRVKVLDWNGGVLTRTALPTFEPERNVVNVEYRFEYEQGSFSELHTLRYLFKEEVETFSAPYFETKSILGWRRSSTATSADWNAVAVLMRK